jgi:hypothetical protein
MARPRLTLTDKLWNRVEKTPTCWNWTGDTVGRSTQYGRITHGRGTILRVHRVSWELHNGTIPTDKIVLHSCGNSLCVNPEHLRLGSYVENAADSLAARTWGNQYHKGLGPKGTNGK